MFHRSHKIFTHRLTKDRNWEFGATEETICNFHAPVFVTVNSYRNKNSYVFEIRLLNLIYDFRSF